MREWSVGRMDGMRDACVGLPYQPPILHRLDMHDSAYLPTYPSTQRQTKHPQPTRPRHASQTRVHVFSPRSSSVTYSPDREMPAKRRQAKRQHGEFKATTSKSEQKEKIRFLQGQGIHEPRMPSPRGRAHTWSRSRAAMPSHSAPIRFKFPFLQRTRYEI
ncbi:hypothetical protein P171DRAFT_98968 [Karstenula rhodostoma CBS 690.94]|uniref:Uncharacterized protein n=1 Tax=Karstenula rhodostoma CBS 690.94 TaxID=1392251 RepID=A0A9P4PAG7_9PLEO|nr:hypothetical protein P171DRAFT_98968 [Karstenula rhodostoma CBS 690.94]